MTNKEQEEDESEVNIGYTVLSLILITEIGNIILCASQKYRRN